MGVHIAGDNYFLPPLMRAPPPETDIDSRGNNATSRIYTSIPDS